MAAEERPRTRWPKVLGIISLIYAICGMMCQTCMGSFYVAGSLIPAMFRVGMEAPVILRVTFGALAALEVVIGVVMLVGSIRLLNRRRSSMSLLKAWIVARLTLLVIGLGLSVALMPAQIEMARSSERWVAEMAAQDPAAAAQFPPPKTEKELRTQTLISTVAFTVVLAVYPLFLGLWLTRRKIVDEVETWTD